jgi:hypothetical protein
VTDIGTQQGYTPNELGWLYRVSPDFICDEIKAGSVRSTPAASDAAVRVTLSCRTTSSHGNNPAQPQYLTD